MIFCFNAKEFKLSVKDFFPIFLEKKQTVIFVTFVKCKKFPSDWCMADPLLILTKDFLIIILSLPTLRIFSLLPFLLLSGRILSNNWMDLMPNCSIKDRLTIKEENGENHEYYW